MLLLLKILAISLTIGSGGSGGVFAPSLFIGAMLGAAFGTAVNQLFPGVARPVGAYVLVGMGSVFSASDQFSQSGQRGLVVLNEDEELEGS